MSKEFENKKKYLLKRIKEEYDFLKKMANLNPFSELSYIINMSKDNFFYSAPEVVDECFEFLKRIIDLDENFNKTNEYPHKFGLNMYGDPIRCYVCDSLDHVQIDCTKT